MHAKQEILKMLAEGEVVEGVVIGAKCGCYSDYDDDDEEYGEPAAPVLTWDEAGPQLQLFSGVGGFGSYGGRKTYVWTNTRVLFISEYDGSSCWNDVPRDPAACVPGFG